MAARSYAISLTLLVATAAGCAVQRAAKTGAGPASPALVFMQVQVPGNASAWEASRNDERVLGRTGPAAAAVRQQSVVESRQRLSISAGRPGESTTFTWWTVRVAR